MVHSLIIKFDLHAAFSMRSFAELVSQEITSIIAYNINGCADDIIIKQFEKVHKDIRICKTFSKLRIKTVDINLFTALLGLFGNYEKSLETRKFERWGFWASGNWLSWAVFTIHRESFAGRGRNRFLTLRNL